MHRARVEKHRFGGAMRQAGIVAAAGLYALDHNVERLAEDHARARRLAEAWVAQGVPIDLERVQTNFVQLDVEALGLGEWEAIDLLQERRCCALADDAAGSAPRRHAPRPRATTTSNGRSSSCRRRWERMSTPDALDRLLAERQADRLPSVAAAVVRKGELVWSNAVGAADYDDGREATPDTQYRIGSITKTFTATAIMQLRAEGSSTSTTGSSSTSTASRTARRRSGGCCATSRACSARRGRCS